MTYTGQALRRDEDRRLLTGRGRYVGDIHLEHTAHLEFLRSPHARARITGIDLEPARAMPGVLWVLSAREWAAQGLGPDLPRVAGVPFDDGRPMNEAPRPVFARDVVQHVGDSVAAVVAETREQARDAAERIEVEYEDLPAITDVARALEPAAPVLHEVLGTNVVHEVAHGDAAETAIAFERADHVTRLEIRNHRITGNPMEPRNCLGHYDAAADRYTLWASTQVPHALRWWLAEWSLFVPMQKVRVIAPDVGGGFGTKAYYYMEHPVALVASRHVGRPVRFTPMRTETMQSDAQARDHVTQARMAFDAEGRILGLEVQTIAAFGAYQNQFNAFIPARAYPATFSGLYRLTAIHVKVTGVYTNTLPVDAYRGSTQSSVSVLERLVENGARELGIDVETVRRRNYIQPGDYPYATVLGMVYDTGDPPGQHALMLSLSSYAALRREQQAYRQPGSRIGIGLAAIIETAGHGPSRQLAKEFGGGRMGFWEGARVQVHADGRTTLLVGTLSHGQGHEITFRQLAADRLGIPIEHVDLLQGDTDRDPGNFGTVAARSLCTTGIGIVEASRRLLDKGARLAAHVMECDAADVAYEHGQFTIRGTDRSMSFAEIALLAHTGADYPVDFDLGLDQTIHYDPSDYSYPTALHLAVVIVDTETGVVRLREYYAVDDCGTVVNPMIVHGQVHGGLAQGIGQALMERVVYDEESGQLLSGSFMDYCMPRADDLPSFGVDFQCTPSSSNPLGVKGCSESGSCGPPAAIGNAIVDALWDEGLRHLDQPYTPERVWQAMREAPTAPG